MAPLTRLRLLFLACLASGTVLLLARVPWEARLRAPTADGTHEWVIRLDRGPVWDPPPAPSREQFEEHFGRDKPPASGGEITRKADWAEVFDEGMLGLWVIAFGSALAYHGLRGERTDLVFQICSRLAWTIPAWGLVCVLVWLVVGGWGPPCCPGFLSLGLLHGLVAGVSSCADSAQRPPAARGAEADRPVS